MLPTVRTTVGDYCVIMVPQGVLLDWSRFCHELQREPRSSTLAKAAGARVDHSCWNRGAPRAQGTSLKAWVEWMCSASSAQ